MNHPAEEPTARLARHGYLFLRPQYTIRDSLYGSVPLLPAAYKTLDTRLFQRLKHLKQLGPAYLVYPGATHTRFSHSVGVYHLARLALQHLTAQADIEPEVGRATLAAALLHDIGHFPFSHVLDDLSMHGKRLSHTELGVDLVQSDGELQSVLRDDWEVNSALVLDIMSGTPNPRIPRFLYTLTDGPMDVDKLDYLNRDSHHSGAPYGRIEVQRLIECLAVDPTTGELVITEPGVGTVESVVFAKYLMFRYVYWHHTSRIAGAMINRAVLDCLLALGVTELSVRHPLVHRVCMATDATLGEELRSMLHEANVAEPPALDLLQRVDDRRLYKRALVIPCAQVPEEDARFRHSLAKRERESELAAAISAGLSESSPLDSSSVLIDVPPVAKFAVDVSGVLVDDGGRSHVVPWEGSSQASYLTAETVAGMERSLRSVLYLCDTHRDDGEAVRQALGEAARG